VLEQAVCTRPTINRTMKTLYLRNMALCLLLSLPKGFLPRITRIFTNFSFFVLIRETCPEPGRRVRGR